MKLAAFRCESVASQDTQFKIGHINWSSITHVDAWGFKYLWNVVIFFFRPKTMFEHTGQTKMKATQKPHAAVENHNLSNYLINFAFNFFKINALEKWLQISILATNKMDYNARSECAAPNLGRIVQCFISTRDTFVRSLVGSLHAVHTMLLLSKARSKLSTILLLLFKLFIETSSLELNCCVSINKTYNDFSRSMCVCVCFSFLLRHHDCSSNDTRAQANATLRPIRYSLILLMKAIIVMTEELRVFVAISFGCVRYAHALDREWPAKHGQFGALIWANEFARCCSETFHFCPLHAVAHIEVVPFFSLIEILKMCKHITITKRSRFKCKIAAPATYCIWYE